MSFLPRPRPAVIVVVLVVAALAGAVLVAASTAGAADEQRYTVVLDNAPPGFVDAWARIKSAVTPSPLNQ